MNTLLEDIGRNFLVPTTVIGAVFYGAVFLCGAVAAARLIRVVAIHSERHLTDVTALRFVVQLLQVCAFVVAFILYTHLIPPLRALATALLTGVSVVSIVVGVAAQNTLGNLIAGFSLVLYHPFDVGDVVQLTTPKGLTTGTVEALALGYTRLRDAEGAAIIVPNSVMVSSVIVLMGRKAAPHEAAQR
jgi:moderate conductance mechanosensitive channel